MTQHFDSDGISEATEWIFLGILVQGQPPVPRCPSKNSAGNLWSPEFLENLEGGG